MWQLHGITLLHAIYKVFYGISQSMLSICAEEILGEYQYGFPPGSGASDLQVLFIDFCQAFNNIRKQGKHAGFTKGNQCSTEVNQVSGVCANAVDIGAHGIQIRSEKLWDLELTKKKNKLDEYISNGVQKTEDMAFGQCNFESVKCFSSLVLSRMGRAY